MLKASKKKGGSKSKRKGAKNTGHPIPLWRRCNPQWVSEDPARTGQFESREREYSNGSTQYRGHVHLADCGCQQALGPRPKSEAEIVRAKQLKGIAKRTEMQIAKARLCPDCFTLLPVNGHCADCTPLAVATPVIVSKHVAKPKRNTEADTTDV